MILNFSAYLPPSGCVKELWFREFVVVLVRSTVSRHELKLIIRYSALVIFNDHSYETMKHCHSYISVTHQSCSFIAFHNGGILLKTVATLVSIVHFEVVYIVEVRMYYNSYSWRMTW